MVATRPTLEIQQHQLLAQNRVAVPAINAKKFMAQQPGHVAIIMHQSGARMSKGTQSNEAARNDTVHFSHQREALTATSKAERQRETESHRRNREITRKREKSKQTQSEQER